MSTKDTPPSPPRPAADRAERERREAEALRENLRWRKEQVRVRPPATKAPGTDVTREPATE